LRGLPTGRFGGSGQLSNLGRSGRTVGWSRCGAVISANFTATSRNPNSTNRSFTQLAARRSTTVAIGTSGIFSNIIFNRAGYSRINYFNGP
jgi:hypothetical protein